MRTAWAAASLLLAAAPAAAHSVDYRVQGDGHVMIAFQGPGGGALAGVAAKVFRPGEPAAPAYAVTADDAGQVAFTADRDGVWRVDLTSPDGHVDRVLVPFAGGLPAAPRAASLRWLIAISLTGNIVAVLLAAAPRLRAHRSRSALAYPRRHEERVP